jgi:DNA anti-recombination protein RmuC
MKRSGYLMGLMVLIFLAFSMVGCHPKIDTMSKAEKIFIKMVDKGAAKLNLNDEQKIQLVQLKADLRKNFLEGRIERKDALKKIKEEGLKENPDIQIMTSSLQGLFQDDAQRINRAFDLLLGYQKNLNEDQKKKLTQMISEWVKKWD